MPNARTNNKKGNTASPADLNSLEERIAALERRVAILEAKQVKPSLAEKISDTRVYPPENDATPLGDDLSE